MRLRVLGTGAVAIALAASAAAAVPATAETAPGPTAVAAPTVASVTDLGPMPRHPAIRGRDNARSALLGGRSVWTYGDTMLSTTRVNGSNWSDNTVSWTADLDASNGVSGWSDLLDRAGAPTEFLPLTQQERAYNDAHRGDDCEVEPCHAEFALWPGELVADPARNRLLVFYGIIHRVIGQPEFTPVGNSIATWSPGTGFVRPVVSPGTKAPTMMFGPKGFGLGNGSVVVGSTLYNYGCQPAWIVTRCQLARVPLVDVLDKSAWRYFAGNGVWSASPDDAAAVLDGGAAGTSVQWVPYLNAFLAVYSQNFNDDVMYRVSPKPEGPWSEAKKLFTGVAGQQGTYNYAAAAHVEYAVDNGRTQFVTYVRNTGFLQQEVRQVRVVFDAAG